MNNTVSLSGKIDGQKLYHALSERAKRMKDSWCRISGQNNAARAQQLTQMFNRYLAEQFPAGTDQLENDLHTIVRWSGSIDKGIITLKISTREPKAERILEQISKSVFIQLVIRS